MAADLIVPLSAHLLREFLRYRDRMTARSLSDEDAIERFVSEARAEYRATAEAAEAAIARRMAQLAEDDGA